MISKGKKITGNPVLIRTGGKMSKPERISFSSKEFYEDWLQEIIFEHPELLPVEEIEPVFSPLISIAREFSTNAGPIDNIFISPSGYITIVETKLWRNPESRRLVVGQLLDYAKELSGWTFEEFDSQVRYSDVQTKTGENRGVIDLIRQVVGEENVQESAVIDTISRNLKNGRFLLLIVGDGIREEMEAMVDYLNQTPQLHFNLALVELMVFELADHSGDRLVVPQVVARTIEITRAIVKVEGTDIEKITVEVDTPSTVSTSKPGRRFRLTEDEFFKILTANTKESEVKFAREILDDADQRGYQVDWMQANFGVKYRDKENSDIALTVLLVHKEGTVAPGYILGSLRENDRVYQFSKDFVAKTAKLFEGVKPGKDTETWDTAVALESFQAQYDQYMRIVEETISKLHSLAEDIAQNS